MGVTVCYLIILYVFMLNLLDGSQKLENCTQECSTRVPHQSGYQIAKESGNSAFLVMILIMKGEGMQITLNRMGS